MEDSVENFDNNKKDVQVRDLDIDLSWKAFRETCLSIGKKEETGGIIVYGTSDMGMTYTLLNPNEGIFPKLGMRTSHFNIFYENYRSCYYEALENPDNLPDKNSYFEGPIVGLNNEDQLHINKDNYEYITIKSEISPERLFILLQEHNGKCIVFKDCDSMLKKGKTSEAIVSILKMAMNKSGDREVQWKDYGPTTPATEFSGIPGAIATRKRNNTTHYKLPLSFNFNGQVIFISKLKRDEISQDLLSNVKSVDLHMTLEERLKKIKRIAGEIIFYNPEGKPFLVSKECRANAIKFMEIFMHEFSDSDFHIRTYIRIAEWYQFSLKRDEDLRTTNQTLQLMFLS